MFDIEGLIALVEDGGVLLEAHGLFWSLCFRGRGARVRLALVRHGLYLTLENAHTGRRIRGIPQPALRRLARAIRRNLRDSDALQLASDIGHALAARAERQYAKLMSS